jgi:hypothetical protein
MTDYRVRNHDLLYADRGKRPLNWRTVLVFGAVAVTVTLGVVAHLTDRFNAAPAGFTAAQQSAPKPAMHLATPTGSRSG